MLKRCWLASAISGVRGWQRQLVTINVAMLPGQVITIGIELLMINTFVFQLRNGPGNRISRRSTVSIKFTGAQWNKPGLIMHVLAAAAKNSYSRCRKQQPGSADLCRTVNTAPP